MYFKQRYFEVTPATGASESFDGLTGAQIKGILKKGGAMEDPDLNERLMCSVPEHHDLEDYISQLQSKIKRLKTKLRDEQEMSLEDSKRVFFEEDREREAVDRIKEELHDRRQELEGLDLAVEQQKNQLSRMRKKERRLRERNRTTRESSRTDGGYPRTTHAQRQAFLNREMESDDFDSDDSLDLSSYDSPRRSSDRGHRDVHRLEGTLAKRRAELRATDKLLNDCELDLADLQQKLKNTVQQYQNSQDGFRTTASDLEDMKRVARDTDSLLLKEREQLRLIQRESEELQTEKRQHEVTLSEMKQLISSKDAEVNNLEAKVKQSTKKLQEIQLELTLAESQHRERQTLIKDSDRVVTERRKELQHLQRQISDEKSELDKMNQQMGLEKADLELTMDSVKKRRGQLESLDKELTNEVEQKRKELKDIDRQLAELQHERKKYTQDLKQEEVHLDHMQSESRKRALEVDSLQRQISSSHDEVDALLAQKHSLESSIKTLHAEKHGLEEDAHDLHGKVGDLRRSHGQMEIDVETRHRQLSSLEGLLQRVEQVLASLPQQHVTSAMNGDGAMLHKIDDRNGFGLFSDNGYRPIRNPLESDMERAFTQLEKTRSELSKNQQHLKSVIDRAEGLKRDDRRNEADGRYAYLEDRLKAIAQEIISRENEKEHLKSGLAKSNQEVTDLQQQMKKSQDEMSQKVRHLEAEIKCLRQELDDRVKELQHIRKKSASEITDLEGIAQAHCSRANRLGDELSYLRSEYIEVKRQLDCQKEIVERDQRLENSIKDLKSDIKYEVTDSIVDQEKVKEDTLAEISQLQEQQNTLSNQLSALKQNLSMTRSQDSGVFFNTDSFRESLMEPSYLKINSSDSMRVNNANSDHLKESFTEHQNFLKNQLAAKMARQSELLKAQRQISEENIQNLQRKVLCVEQVFSQADSGSQVLSPASDIPPALSDRDLVTDVNDVSEKAQQVPSVSRQGYSPHRYSSNRSLRYSTALDLPERDAS